MRRRCSGRLACDGQREGGVPTGILSTFVATSLRPPLCKHEQGRLHLLWLLLLRPSLAHTMSLLVSELDPAARRRSGHAVVCGHKGLLNCDTPQLGPILFAGS